MHLSLPRLSLDLPSLVDASNQLARLLPLISHLHALPPHQMFHLVPRLPMIKTIKMINNYSGTVNVHPLRQVTVVVTHTLRLRLKTSPPRRLHAQNVHTAILSIRMMKATALLTSLKSCSANHRFFKRLSRLLFSTPSSLTLHQIPVPYTAIPMLWLPLQYCSPRVRVCALSYSTLIQFETVELFYPA
jgi:hypothetical protein